MMMLLSTILPIARQVLRTQYNYASTLKYLGTYVLS